MNYTLSATLEVFFYFNKNVCFLANDGSIVDLGNI